MQDKIFCGSGKVIQTQYGELMKISFSKDDINTIVKWMKENDREWANMAVKEKREPQQGKSTHYIELDQWVPEQRNQAPQPKPEPKPEPFVSDAIPDDGKSMKQQIMERQTPPPKDDDLPF